MRRILLVEDDRDVRETLGGILVALGYQVELAPDGARALAMLQTGPSPDLVLLDLQMPNMDGYRFRAIQKADPVLAKIPVVVITAERRADLDALGLASIRKPFDPAKLIELIEEQCGVLR